MTSIKYPIRVLHVFSDPVPNAIGGVEQMMIRLGKKMDHHKIVFDCLSVYNIPQRPLSCAFDMWGGQVFNLGLDTFTTRNYFFKVFFKAYSFFIKNKYVIVHINETSRSLHFIMLLAAACARIKIRISHSHSTFSTNNFWKKIFLFPLKLIISFLSTHLLTCSVAAAYSLFNSYYVYNNYVTKINNGIDLENFVFNQDTRINVRNKLQITDKIVIGHIGNFIEAKNHRFLIDIFYKVHKLNPDTILLLIGDGPLQKYIKDLIASLGLTDAVIFMGRRSDISELLQAMDIFVFPSLFEGVGIVLIEAQAVGLPCVVSDTIPEEARITSLITALPLSDKVEWSKKILSIACKPSHDRNMTLSIKNSGYDIKDSAIKLQDYYVKTISKVI